MEFKFYTKLAFELAINKTFREDIFNYHLIHFQEKNVE